MELKQLRLENFKIFQKASFDFRPLTLLTGTNSSGKSTILNAITAILQAQPTHTFPFEFLPNGKNCLLGSFRDISFGRNTRTKFSLGLTLENEPGSKINIDGSYRFSSKTNQILPDRLALSSNEDSFEVKWFGYERGYRAVIKSQTHERMVADKSIGELRKSLVSFMSSVEKKSAKTSKTKERNKYKQFEEKLFGKQSDKWFDLKSRNPNVLLREMINQPAGGYFFQMLSIVSHGLANGFSYIGPVRVYPSRFYQSEDLGQLVEPMGKNSVTLLYEWRKNSPQKYRQAIDLIKLLELATKIETKTSLDEILKLHVQPFEHKEKVNIADVGFGISQVLPILAADVALPTKGTLLVNQPEVHLHPSSQALLANYFSSRLKTRRYIIETHSEYLINRLRLLVVEGKVDTKDVSILFLEPPTGRMKNPKVHYIEIGKDGSLLNAPKSFFSTYYLDTFNIAMGGFSNGK